MCSGTKTDGQEHTAACTRTPILTSVTRGSGVSCPITGTAEAIPCLFTPAAVFTVVWHTPVERDTCCFKKKEIHAFTM